jgi:sigma-B regulation protein RsbU (phosphoserine phosphatase)
MKVLVAKGIALEKELRAELGNMMEPLLLDESKSYNQLKSLGISLLVPMRLQDETNGILALGPKISGAAFDEADIEFLKTLGNQATTSLENARLFEEALEKQRMEEELNLARSIQTGLLPSELPVMSNYDIAAINIPSRQVGGDYFDVIQISDSLYGITIADVSGKGAGAALLMASLQASLRALIGGDMAISEIVTRINQLIYQNTGLDKYITFFYGELDVQKHTFTYCNAGHNPPYLIDQKGSVRELMVGGIVIGMMTGVPFETAKIQLNQDDCIVMYTDGITEAMDEKEEEYTEKRLLVFLDQHKSQSAKEILDGTVSEVKTFSGTAPQADDITMVVLKRMPSQ